MTKQYDSLLDGAVWNLKEWEEENRVLIQRACGLGFSGSWEHYREEKKNMAKIFTKSDLKSGHRVTLRDGSKGVVFKDLGIISFFDSNWISMAGLGQNLKYSDTKGGCDIVLVEYMTEWELLDESKQGMLLYKEPQQPTEQDILMKKIAYHEKSLAELKEQAKKLEK